MKNNKLKEIKTFCNNPLAHESYKELRDRYEAEKIDQIQLWFEYDKLQYERRNKFYSFNHVILPNGKKLKNIDNN